MERRFLEGEEVKWEGEVDGWGVSGSHSGDGIVEDLAAEAASVSLRVTGEILPSPF